MAANSPLISVVMPAFNAERYVAEAIESIQAQTYEHWELICVDDCSTDGTPAIIEAAAAGDSRIRRVPLEGRGGHGIARNVGIGHAAGGYIAFQDADDVSLPRRLADTVAAFEQHSEVGAVGSGAYLMDSCGRPCGVDPPPKRPPAEWAAVWPALRAPIAHSSLAARAQLLREVGGYDIRFGGVIDFDLEMRLWLRASFWVSPEPWVRYRLHLAQMTKAGGFAFLTPVALRRMEALQAGAEFDVDTALIEARANPRYQACDLLMAGWSALEASDLRAARAHFAAAVRLQPRMPGALCPWIASLLPGPLGRAACRSVMRAVQWRYRNL